MACLAKGCMEKKVARLGVHIDHEGGGLGRVSFVR